MALALALMVRGAGADPIVIPAGPFWMGRDVPDPMNCPETCWHDDEMAGHWVDLDEFAIEPYEVTNGQYVTFLNAVGVTSDNEGHAYIDAEDPDIHIRFLNGQWEVDAGWESHPMVEVSWHGAQAYCAWVGGRLPTEAEWEKAAGWDPVAGASRWYPWGEEFSCVVSSWQCNDPPTTRISTKPVGTFPGGASAYGLYDMAGNVWEWTGGGYSSYPGVPESAGPFEAFFMAAQRGGSWRNTYYNLRSVVRSPAPPGITEDNVGFRVCYSDTHPSPPPVVVPPRAVYEEWVEDFSTSIPLAETYTWWSYGGASYGVDTTNGWMVARMFNNSNPSNVGGEHMGMIRRDTGDLFAPGDYVDITARIKYDRADRAYARSSVGVSWGDTRGIVPGGRGADENFGHPWYLVANSTDTANTWHEVTLERVRWGEGALCIGFGLWANLSHKALPPIVGQQGIWVDWLRVRHSQPWTPEALVDFSADVTEGIAPQPVQFSDHSLVAGASAWLWDFGDGHTSTEHKPLHTYTQPGVYTVRLTVTGTGGTLYARKIGYIKVVEEKVDFSADVLGGGAPLSVQFTDLSEVRGASAWWWDFGDGQTSTQQHPAHVYTMEGAYSVRLTVTGDGGDQSVEKPAFITVATLPSVAFIGAMPFNAADVEIIQRLQAMKLSVTQYPDEPGQRPSAAQIAATHDLVIGSSTLYVGYINGEFRNQAVPFLYWEPTLNTVAREALSSIGLSTGGQTQINVVDNTHPIMAGVPLGPVTVTTEPSTMSYGAGTLGSGVRVLATHVSDPSSRMIMVAERGATLADGGAAAHRRISLHLHNSTWSVSNDIGRLIFENAVVYALGGVAAGFSAQTLTGDSPLQVQFTDESTGPVTSWSWDFGDGSTSGQRHPAHVYEAPGLYTVSLTVRGLGQPSTLRRQDYLLVGPFAPVDLDTDGDVDADDLGSFQACARGPAIAHDGSDLCAAADVDGDGDVDQSDFGRLQACFNGAGVWVDPGCGAHQAMGAPPVQ
jgi:PKD repeat protein/formylglycine-generating enzyme required for sulfatase activity